MNRVQLLKIVITITKQKYLPDYFYLNRYFVIIISVNIMSCQNHTSQEHER